VKLNTRHRHAETRTSRLQNRDGFTLVEAVVASVILTAALLAMAGFTVRYQQDDTGARLAARAQQAVNERLERVRSSQPYHAIDSMVTTESSLPSFAGFTRTTTVTHVGGTATDTVDYRIITVSVTTPQNVVVKKSSIIGAF
jgi:Tfp pilus assembly protein PilV